jgi:hypothetical protein
MGVVVIVFPRGRSAATTLAGVSVTETTIDPPLAVEEESVIAVVLVPEACTETTWEGLIQISVPLAFVNFTKTIVHSPERNTRQIATEYWNFLNSNTVLLSSSRCSLAKVITTVA